MGSSNAPLGGSRTITSPVPAECQTVPTFTIVGEVGRSLTFGSVLAC